MINQIFILKILLSGPTSSCHDSLIRLAGKIFNELPIHRIFSQYPD